MDKQPIIGWLVCTEGENRGKDYRIVQGSNGIGSSENMPIMINDGNILAENHATIVFDDRCRKCYIAPGFGKKIVRLNGVIVFGSIYLKAYDKIEIGNNEYVFIPYACSPDQEKPLQYVKKKGKQPCMDLLSDMGTFKENPVVGWLVVTEGNNAGTDFRITADFNYIGKTEKCDINVSWDANMNDDKQAAIVYDSRDNAFFLMPMNSAVTYVSGQMIGNVVQLKGFEEIYTGSSRFIFVPFCGDYYRWDEKKAE